MSPPKHGATARGALYAALSGRAGADVSGGAGGDLRGQLLAAFGPGAKDATRPNTKAAATALGVSMRTVQRWLAAPGQERTAPRPATRQQITRASKRAASTKAGRASATAGARQRVSRHGMSVHIRGVQGPISRDYLRNRRTIMHLDPHHADAFFDAYVNGGENGALSWLADHSGEVYGVNDWIFKDVTGFEARGLYD